MHEAAEMPERQKRKCHVVAANSSSRARSLSRAKWDARPLTCGIS
jgi:hypothetical protein